MGKIVKNGVTYSGSSDNADNVKYNNNVSNLDATNVQEAITEVNSKLENLVKSKNYSVTTNNNGIGTILFDGYCIGFGNNQGYAMSLVTNQGIGASFIFKTASGSIASNKTFDGVIYYI